MAEIKWIKISTSMFDDEKIDYIESLPDADSIIVIWVKLLTLAGKCNAGGYIFLTESIPYTEDMLAHKFKRQINTVRFALKTFESLKMIEFINGFITLSNWEKHQNIEGMEKIREQTKIRMRKYRQKLLTGDVTVTSRDDLDLDLDQDIDIDLNKEVSKKFHPPTIDEVKNYCIERKNKVDPQRFIDFYESKGWMVGKNKMKSWQAAVRTWERGNNGSSTPENIKPASGKGQSELDGIDFTKFEYKG